MKKHFYQAQTIFVYREKEHALALASRGEKYLKRGPGAIGYFIGYRICEAYVSGRAPTAGKTSTGYLYANFGPQADWKKNLAFNL